MRHKQVCADCHFLCQFDREGGRETAGDVSGEERARARAGDFSWVLDGIILGCSFKVWDEGYASPRSARPRVIAETDRRDFCFYLPHASGMLIPAAERLQQMKWQARMAARDRRVSIVAVVIAAIALLANLVVQVLVAKHVWFFK